MRMVYQMKKYNMDHDRKLKALKDKICCDKFKRGFVIGAVFGALVALILTDTDDDK